MNILIVTFVVLVSCFGCTLAGEKVNTPKINPLNTTTKTKCKYIEYGQHRHYKYEQYSGALDYIDGKGLRPEVAKAFLEMAEAASNQGITLSVVSGYRSYNDQEYLFEDLRMAKGQTKEERAYVSAPVGYSEHSTARVVDINDVEDRFVDTEAYRWLQNNANKYGFELSFPKGNSQNISFEPWHWRYVGKDGEFKDQFCP